MRPLILFNSRWNGLEANVKELMQRMKFKHVTIFKDVIHYNRIQNGGKEALRRERKNETKPSIKPTYLLIADSIFNRATNYYPHIYI